MALVVPAAHAASSTDAPYVVEQTRGVDQRITYKSLEKYGPWDDRNYEVTLEDLALLPDDDQYLNRVPAFFKILKRKEFISEGFPLDDVYPREIHFEFYIRFGGLMRNGQVVPKSLGKVYYPTPNKPNFPAGTRDATVPMAAPVEGEGPLAIGNNETAIEVNPVNPLVVIAGSNGSGGQNQNWSNDGGVTWNSGGSLPSTCCDPALEWSVDGTVAYAATLGNAAGGQLRATVFRSTNGGMTWGNRVDVSTGDTDKEFIHVDHSPSSPFQDNVYMTWHQGNVMHFARSTDRALTWSSPLVFSSSPTGIGSDITTDPAGNVYYFYPTLNRSGSQAILVLKSTDGGVSFGAPVVVGLLSGRFDFAIPSMESRRAFIYVAADTDPNTGRIWATWTDNTPASVGPSGSASQNVAWIRVASSIDGGATWQLAATPHAAPLPPSTSAVDRYHPWISVDQGGTVHLGFYDTRHSPNRTGVDFYYVASSDGGATWVEETRVSASTSVNITNGQEWGDYNGLDVNNGQNNIAMTWTDNRVVGASPLQRSFAARVSNLFSEPTFQLGVSGSTDLVVCAGTPLPPITVNVSSISDYDQPVTLTTPNLNLTAFGAGSFSVNPVTPAQPAATSVLTLNTLGSAGTNTYPLTIRGVAGIGPSEMTKEVDLTVATFGGVPAAPVLTAPANGAVGQSTQPTLSWSAATGAVEYFVELATDPGFTNVIFSALTENTSVQTSALADNTTYFWRVTASNPCGESTTSAEFSFKTQPAPGSCDDTQVASVLFSEDFSSGLGGFATTGSTGASTWAISTARPSPASGGNAALAVDLTTSSDQRLISPSIVLPSDQSPITLQFWNDQDLEVRTAGGCWDAGLLEISTNDGSTWTQVPNGAMLTQPYDGNIAAGAGSGLQGWCGDPVPYTRSIVDLNAFAGQTVRLRWRVSTDTSVGSVPHGWYVDDIRVQSCVTSVQADLSIDKTVDNAVAAIGSSVVFTLTASNLGSADATSVAVTDALPSGYAFVSANASAGSYSSGTGIWTIGDLDNAQTETLEITATMLASGNYLNVASIAGAEADPDDLNNSDSVSVVAADPGSADLSIVKEVDVTGAGFGETVTFTLTASNAGPAAATGVAVTDLLPAGYSFTGSSASTGSYNDGTGIWTIGSMAVDATETLTITATITLTDAYLNSASIDGNEADPQAGNDTDSVSAQPSISLGIHRDGFEDPAP